GEFRLGRVSEREPQGGRARRLRRPPRARSFGCGLERHAVRVRAREFAGLARPRRAGAVGKALRAGSRSAGVDECRAASAGEAREGFAPALARPREGHVALRRELRRVAAARLPTRRLRFERGRIRRATAGAVTPAAQTRHMTRRPELGVEYERLTTETQRWHRGNKISVPSLCSLCLRG